MISTPHADSAESQDPLPRGRERADSTIAACLALFLFSIYLLSFSGQLYSQDSMSMFSVTESLVKRGEFNTDQLWTLFKARDELAADGESYAKYGYGASLFAAPLYALALALPGLGLVQTALLSSAVVIALTGALLFLSARRLRYSRAVSLAAALLFGLATPAWVYAKQLWSEPFGLFTLFAAFYFLLRFRQEGSGRDALVAGVALGLAVATRLTNVLLVPFFLLYGFARVLKDVRVRRGLVLFAAALALLGLSVAWYDWVRYGSPLLTGYRADEQFNTPLLLGLYGLLFSPGKGLFVYVPFLAVLAWAGGAFHRRARAEALLFLAVSVVYLVVFSTWYYWWGGTNWSPRFLVPLLPFLVLATAPALELIESERRAAGRAYAAFTVLVGVLVLFSFVIELLGITIPSLAYRLALLKVSSQPDADAIFRPLSSPLVGAWSLIKPRALDLAWIRHVGPAAEVDWVVVALTVALILLCGGMLVNSYRGGRMATGLVMGAVVLAFGLSLFSMYRYREDERFGGGDGYRAVLQTITAGVQAGDVVILNDDAQAPFLFNEDRARTRWYGLSRDPAQWDAATRALLERICGQYARIWFISDDSAATQPDPTRAWLEQSAGQGGALPIAARGTCRLQKAAQSDFQDGVHLTLYAGVR